MVPADAFLEYRSVADLGGRVVDWCRVLPPDLDLIVGIPRSGMLAATILALHLNLPLADLDGFLKGRTLMSGQRPLRREPGTGRAKVLVVDDSVLSGAEMDKARRTISEGRVPHHVRYGAVFASPLAVREGKVDFYAELVPPPRVFEWNIMHGQHLSRACVDIDGVLCRDPSDHENDDGSRYLRFLESVPPLAPPRHEIGWLVTSRLEKYREPTERWLQHHGVEYGELIMMEYPDMKARRAAQAYGEFKAAVYRSRPADLFIESSPPLAAEIASLAGKPVFSFETREMLYPGEAPRRAHLPVRPLHPLEKGARWVARFPIRVLRKIGRLLAS